MEKTTTTTTITTESTLPEILKEFRKLQESQKKNGIPVTEWSEILDSVNKIRNEETTGIPPNVPETPRAGAGDNPVQTATVKPTVPSSTGTGQQAAAEVKVPPIVPNPAQIDTVNPTVPSSASTGQQAPAEVNVLEDAATVPAPPSPVRVQKPIKREPKPKTGAPKATRRSKRIKAIKKSATCKQEEPATKNTKYLLRSR